MALSEISTSLSTQTQRRLDAFFASVGQGVNAYIEILSRRAEIAALDARTDAELASMGLTREDIPRHVFRDKLGM